MKILIYLDSMAPAGGIERVVSIHCAFFAKQYPTTLLTKDNLDSFYPLPSNVNIQTLSITDKYNMQNRMQRIFLTLKQLFMIRKRLKKYTDHYDLIYCTHIRNLLELYISGVNLKKVIVTEHGSYFGYNQIYKKLKQFLYPKCKFIVSPTSMDYKIYQSQNCNAIYIPNPLSFYNENMSELNSKTVINIGRLTSDKRQDVLLDIWKNISTKFPEWKLTIIGKGEYQGYLEELIYQYNLEKSVEIVSPTKEVENYFLNASIFLLTSKYEGFGMVLAEAMAYGVPCITFNCPSGPRDIIENGIDGFLIEEGNINDYISKLEIMLTDQEKRVEMGTRAKENIKKFSVDKIQQEWINLLENGKIL